MTIGPMTNAATLLSDSPDAAEKLKGIACMGGEPHRACREHNVSADPEAAQRVFTSGLLRFQASYDVCGRVAMSERHVTAMRDRGSRLCSALFDLIMLWKPHQTTKVWPVVYDACALAWLFAPDLFRTERRSVRVELEDPAGRGMTVFTPDGPELEVTTAVHEEDVLALLTDTIVP